MKTNRRNFLIGSGTVAGLAIAAPYINGIPFLSAKEFVAKNRLLAKEIVMKNLERYHNSLVPSNYYQDLIDLNMWMIDHDEDMRAFGFTESIYETSKMMTKPQDTVLDNRQTFIRRHVFRCEYGLGLVQDLKSICGLDPVLELKNIISAELNFELYRYERKHNVSVCPYIPALMVMSIDHDTFQPKVGFTTLFGVIRKT